MDSFENGDKAEFLEDFINTEIMVTSKEGMEQAGKEIGNNVSVLEKYVKTDLRIQILNDVEITESDQLIGQPAVIAEPKELFADETETVIEVAERVKIVLKLLDNTKTIPALANRDPDNCEGQASAVLEKTNFDEAKMRIVEMCLGTEEILQLFEEAEETLELMGESENILPKLQENLKTLQEENLSTKDNPEKVSQKLESAINTSASGFERLNVDDELLVHSVSTSKPESMQSNDPMTAISITETSQSITSVGENRHDPPPTLQQTIINSIIQCFLFIFCGPCVFFGVIVMYIYTTCRTKLGV